MKKILLIIVSCLVSIGVNSQNGKKFRYEKNQFGAYVVTPIFDQSKEVGMRGTAISSDPWYLSDLFESIAEKVIKKGKVDSLYTEPSFIITINSSGEIINCRFLINSRDLNVISDNDFYNLYLLFKQTKIDMSKVKLVSPNDSVQNKKIDYTIISGTLIPKKFKKTHN